MVFNTDVGWSGGAVWGGTMPSLDEITGDSSWDRHEHT